jgi:hypothetical protein
MRKIAPNLLLFSFALVIALSLVSTLGCSSKSPQEKALAERARWDVLLLNYLQNEETLEITMSTRLSGPRASELQTLTVEFLLEGDGGESLPSIWHSYDLTKVENGGPLDVTVRAPSTMLISGLGLVSPSLPISTEDQSNLVELQGL